MIEMLEDLHDATPGLIITLISPSAKFETRDNLLEGDLIMALRVSWACNLNFHTVTYNVQSVQKWNEYVRYEKSTTTTISCACL